MNDETTDVQTRNALARSAGYGLVAHAFRYPDEQSAAMLGDPLRWTTWPEALAAYDGALRDPLERARRQSADLPPLYQLREAHVGLFGHTLRGPCPAYELEYGRGEIVQKAPLLADIAGFYSAFGVELGAEADERADHISIEAEFMSVLASRLAYALDHGDAEGAAIVRDAERAFLTDHLSRWFPSFCHRVIEADGDGFHAAAAGLARALVAADGAAFGIEPGEAMLELRPSNPEVEAAVTADSDASCASCPLGVELPADAGPPQEIGA